MKQVIATAWHGGESTTNAGTYGVRFRTDERSLMVSHGEKHVMVRLSGLAILIKVGVAPSFWRSCPELRHRKIGPWLRDLGLAPWPKGAPPQLRVTRKSETAELLVEPIR